MNAENQNFYNPFSPEGIFTESVVINKTRFSNTAAKFWPRLIDEVKYRFPRCSVMELSMLSPLLFDREMLCPEKALQNDIDRLWDKDFALMMASTIAEMEILGPPSGVNIRIGEDSCELVAGTLPTEYIDADILPNLIVWLFEWACLPEYTWNNDHLAGTVSALDTARNRTYDITFSLSNSEVSEGLRKITVSLSLS